MKLNDKERKSLYECVEEVRNIAEQLLTAAQLSEKGNHMVDSFIINSFNRSTKITQKLASFCHKNIPAATVKENINLIRIKPCQINKPLEVKRKKNG